jgi:hypothetical protein
MNVDAQLNNRDVFLSSYPSSQSLVFFFVFFGFFLGCGSAMDAAPSVKRIAVHTVPYAKTSSSHLLTKDADNGIVSFFDAQNRLVQERYSYKTKDQCNVRIILAKPRVQLISCPRPRPRPRGAWLEGLDSLGQSQWSYEIRGEKKVSQEEVFGGSREAIVLSELKVIDPETGKVILKSSAKSSFKPRLTVTRSILYIPSSKTFYYYDAEVSLFSKKGGLFRIRPPYETEEKLFSLKWGPLGHVSVDAMAVSQDKKYLSLGKRWNTRGAGWVEFAVFDLAEGEEIFSDRTEESCVCHNLKITVGEKGRVAFSYDQTAVTQAVVYQVDDFPLKERLP